MSRLATAKGTMQALVLDSPGSLCLAQVPVPTPGPGEVLVKVGAALTCGTDLKAFLRGHPQIPMPGLFGHEYSGVVAAVGEGVDFEVGDHVMGVHSAPCRACFWCLNDQENLCEHIMATKVLGAYAEYLLIPAHIARLNLFAKPDSLTFERAALLEPLACVAQAIERFRPKLQDRVLIIGPGAIGLMFTSVLRYLRGRETLDLTPQPPLHRSGEGEIWVAGRNPVRLALAGELGANPVPLDELARDAKFDIVIECTGREEIWERSIDYVRRGGKLVLFGGCPAGTRVSFDTRRLHYDQIDVISPFHFGTRAVRTAREWLLDPTLILEPLISGERSLSEGEAVFRDLIDGKGIKYVFHP